MAHRTSLVLLADSDPALAPFLAPGFGARGIKLVGATDDKSVLLTLQKLPFDVILLDEALPTMGGLRMLALLQERWPGIPVILTSSRQEVVVAVEAIKAGAEDFIRKPLDPEETLFAIERAVARLPTADDEPPPASVLATTQIIGRSPVLLDVLSLLQKVASGQATVLVRGESGTGKELLARRVHELSPRRAGAFVKVHAGALPEQLLESELFGYEKGAFTGATSRKPGRVELAEGGTLFLDEIGDITAATQVKLLRVLQEREYERLGGTSTLKADVRFVAATHKNLEAMVAAGQFREDLYYRLNVVPITAPALRERPEDIPELVRYFATAVSRANSRPEVRIDSAAIKLLCDYEWPGNVRQLQNFVERLVVLAESDTVQAGIVRKELSGLRIIGPSQPAPGLDQRAGAVRRVGELSLGVTALELDEVVRRAERKALEKALDKAAGNRTLAARLLGVSRRTLYNKLAEHGLS